MYNIVCMYVYVTSSRVDQKASIQQQLKLKYNTLSCSKVLQDDPCMTNCHTANHNLNVMHHASSTLQQFHIYKTCMKLSVNEDLTVTVYCVYTDNTLNTAIQVTLIAYRHLTHNSLKRSPCCKWMV